MKKELLSKRIVLTLLFLLFIVLQSRANGKAYTQIDTTINAIRSLVARNNTQPMMTTDGKALNAHETQIMKDPRGKNGYLMFALSYAYCHEGPPGNPKNPTSCPKNYSKCGCRDDHNVSLYTSPNLVQNSWTFISDQLLPMSARPKGKYFRPKVLYHRNSATWVMWVLHGNRAVVSKSSTPEGPFSVYNDNATLLHPSGDLSIFVDDDDTAYVIYNANFKGIAIEQLAPDYLSSLGKTSGVFGIHPSEAPQLLKRKGTYYVFFDKTCCVCAWGSGVRVYTSSSPLGPFTYQIQINRDENEVPIIHSQQCWMMVLHNSDNATEAQYIWIGDRWGSGRDGLHGNDLTYWQPLLWDDSKNPPVPEKFHWLDSFEFNITL